MRPRWRSWGREAIDPHRLRPQRSGGRRGETFLMMSREEWRAPAGARTRPAAWGGGARGRKSQWRRCGQAIGAQPAPPGQIRPSKGRTGRQRTKADRRRWRAAAGVIKGSRWRRGNGTSRQRRARDNPGDGSDMARSDDDRRRQRSRRRLDPQGSNGPGTSRSGRRQRSPAAVSAPSARVKRVGDAELILDDDAVVHVLRPERVALGVAREGGDHRVVDRKTVALGEREAGRVATGGRDRLRRWPDPFGRRGCR